jgi:ADP-heptose:LPS heptosyltransferase
VVLAAPSSLAPLALLSGAVDEVLDARPLAPLGPAAAGAELAVNLHGRGPESHRLLLSTAPRRLLAFAHPAVPESAGLPAWRPGEHEVARWCRLLDECGVPADPARLELPAPALPAPAWARGATLLHPGAGSAARQWPPERWAEVARGERRRGRRVVVTGASAERALALEVAERAGLDSGAALAGSTDLLGLTALVAAAGAVVSGDTGVAHLATALGTPSVVLFGPVSPAEWGPPAGGPHRALWAGATGDSHADRPDPGLLRLTPGDVRAALDELEAVRAGGPPAPRARARDGAPAAPTAGP